MTELSNLSERLPSLAGEVVERYLDTGAPENDAFLHDLDNPQQHEPRWHQYGIVTHSLRAAASYSQELPGYFNEWGLTEEVAHYLDMPIDGSPKSELLSAALLFHDIGKFAARKTVQKDGEQAFTFRGHEALSGAVIRNSSFDFILEDAGISPPQREYVARCAELHYELGKLRQVAKESDAGFTMAFAKSSEFRSSSRQIMDINPRFIPEVGILFLADNLSKLDLRIPADDDEAIESQSDFIADTLAERGLDPRLAQAAKQLPVNIEVARAYLEMWQRSL